MAEYRHPYALDAVAGHLPARVTLAGESYDVADDGTIRGDPPRNAVQRLAAANGLDADDLRDGGTCEVVKSDGEVCGRDLPCPYHSDDEEEDA